MRYIHFPIVKTRTSYCSSKQCGISTRELTQMVHQINREGRPEDRLSDNIYLIFYKTENVSTIYYTKLRNAYEQIHGRINPNAGKRIRRICHLRKICRELLHVMSLFHNYSANNCLLIASQCPHASYVAGCTSCVIISIGK